MNPKFRTLVQESVEGNPQSQKRLFLDYYGYVLLICRRYCKTDFLAEESANDTFLKVFAKLDQYNFDYPFKSWISKIAVNTCIDSIRKEKKTLNLVELKEHELKPYDNSDDIIGFEINEEVLPIIQELPPAYRLVFNLYVFEEYKHREISDLLEISIGTSKSNYARAKKIIIQNILHNEKYVGLKFKIG